MNDKGQKDPKLVTIHSPRSGETVDLSADGTFSASVEVSADVQEVAAWVYPPGASPYPLEPPDGAIRLQNPAQEFEFPDIPGAAGSVEEPHPECVLVIWGRTNAGWSYLDNVQFLGRLQNPITENVSAKCCLWFAWAPADQELSGPQGEQGDQYRPVALSVPSAARNVTLLVGDGLWWHHDADNRRSGANGLDGSGGLPNVELSLEVDAYCSPTYNSDGITRLTTNLNKLVGIWEIDGEAPTATDPADQEVLGQNPGTIGVPEGATRLFLGFHDGRHWTNNDGSIPVTVKWGN